VSSSAVDDLFSLPPEVENQRIRALEQLHLLDTAPEERFARITRMAQLVFGVPIASINLVARHRQWCKQVSGEGVEIDVPRSQSMCQATIARSYDESNEPEMIVEDASVVADFAELPAIASDGIRFYAGYPLYGPGGHAVGTFCILDTQPRSLDGNQRGAFRELAAWAQRELQQSEELERAAVVQRRLLPTALVDLPGYTVSAMCLPAYAVGGDFYDFYPVQGGAIFTVADAMGKGFGAAILAANVRSALRGASRAVDQLADDADLSSAMNSVADQLADDLSQTESFVTLFHARLETATGRVRYVDAGHGIAAVIRAGRRLKSVESTGLPLGIVPGDTWVSQELVLEPGDTLAVASDGVLDLFDTAMGDDTRGAAAELIRANRKPADLCAAFQALASTRPPLDDVTVLAISRDSL
jgi:sigma-B regulation protein RsbU (phosphoserine phosphatase)